jgi:hypothetical protein
MCCINRSIRRCLANNFFNLGSAPAKHTIPMPKKTGIKGKTRPIMPPVTGKEVVRKNMLPPFDDWLYPLLAKALFVPKTPSPSTHDISQAV